MTNVLVTGMSGLIGTALRTALQDDCSLSALNRTAVEGIPTTQASLEDIGAIRPAFVGQDTVIHLAAKIDDSVGWDALLETNVVGTRNVFEAAYDAGVKRVVFTSSGATVAGWELVEPYKAIVEGRYDDVDMPIPLITESMATRPRNQYAATKVWGESIGRYYADTCNLEVVCLRIGYASAADRPEGTRQQSVWNSQRDVVNAIRLAMSVELPEKYDVFFILSNNQWGYRDISRAREVLGFAPLDSA